MYRFPSYESPHISSHSYCNKSDFRPLILIQPAINYRK